MNKFEGYTQPTNSDKGYRVGCFIRISMNKFEGYTQRVGLNRFDWNCCFIRISMNKFEGYTQPKLPHIKLAIRCFIRISMNKFEGYTQQPPPTVWYIWVVLSGFQWTNLKDIHNHATTQSNCFVLFYQDFNEQIWRIYTTLLLWLFPNLRCFIRISMNKFEGYTQQSLSQTRTWLGCFIRISMNKFEGYTQHDTNDCWTPSGCFIRMSMNKFSAKVQKNHEIYKFSGKKIAYIKKKQYLCSNIIWRIYTIRIIPLCKHSGWYASIALFYYLPLYLTLYTLHQPHSLQKMTRIMHFFASKLAYTNKKQ